MSFFERREHTWKKEHRQYIQDSANQASSVTLTIVGDESYVLCSMDFAKYDVGSVQFKLPLDMT